LFITSALHRQPIAVPPHPLAVLRASLAEDLARALGWLHDDHCQSAPQASRQALEHYHSPAYLDALARAEAAQDLPMADKRRFGIGVESNPIHPAVFRRPAVAAGGTLRAAELTAAGGAVFFPFGGNHHAMPARASGFCYLNDAVLGLMHWRALGLGRIAYVDFDAHHGDGVEHAFVHEPDILTISMHEAGRWPRTGTTSDPEHSVLNLPVPPGFDDVSFDHLLQHTIMPALMAHQPEAIMLVIGADALADDPMARLSLSNQALWRALAVIRPLCPRLIVLGGGGYNPYAVARCWAGLWGVLTDQPIPTSLPDSALDVLGGIRYFRAEGRNPPQRWLTTLAD
jgi:acetoin utilization protein AcuC